MTWIEDCLRNSQLLSLLRELQAAEQAEATSEGRKELNYDRTFQGTVVVDHIAKRTLRVTRDDGLVVRGIQINPQIAALLKKGDRLLMVGGLRRGQWRIVAAHRIGPSEDAHCNVH